jgi:hypothetical protein
MGGVPRRGLSRIARDLSPVGVVTLWVLGMRIASAESPPEPPRARLEYTRESGAEACPGPGELASAVAARLGYDPFVDGARAPRVVSVRVSRRGREAHGHVEMRDGGHSSGSRDLASRDCGELVASLAVAVAIGIDPLSLTRAPPAPGSSSPPPRLPPRMPPPPPSRALPQPPPPTPSSAPSAPPEEADPLRFRATAGALVSLGATPTANVGLTASAGARLRIASLALEGRADFPVASSAVTGGGAISASLLVASLVPCVHLGLAQACLLGTVGALRGEGEGVSDPRRDTRLYAAAGGRIGVEVPLGRLVALRAHADLLAPVTQVTYQVNDRDVWTTPPVSAALGLGIAASP